MSLELFLWHIGSVLLADGQTCRLFSGWRSEAGRLMEEGTVLESVLLALHLHALSVIHCLLPSLFLSLSVSFPSSHILLSSSTYFSRRRRWWVSLSDTELSVRNTKQKLGQILHAVHITLEDCVLSQVHCAARSFSNLNFVLCLGRGPSHQLS